MPLTGTDFKAPNVAGPYMIARGPGSWLYQADSLAPKEIEFTPGRNMPAIAGKIKR